MTITISAAFRQFPNLKEHLLILATGISHLRQSYFASSQPGGVKFQKQGYNTGSNKTRLLVDLCKGTALGARPILLSKSQDNLSLCGLNSDYFPPNVVKVQNQVTEAPL